MYKLASYIKVYYEDRTEECSIVPKKEFATVKSAENCAHKKFKSKKYRKDFHQSKVALGAKAMCEFCIVVDDDEERVNDAYWMHREGPDGFVYC